MILETTTLIAVIIAIVEVVKRTGTIDTTKYGPALAIVIGVGLSLLNGFTKDNFLTGIIAALISSGLFDNIKSGYAAGKEIIK